MSDPVQAQNDPSAPAGGPASEVIREAIESGRDVADRVRDVVVSLFRGTEHTAASARAAVSGIVQTASEIVQRSAPSNPDSVLKDVIDGVSTGLKSVAQSTQYAIQEATSRGQRFASEDLDRARRDLNGISDILMDTVKYFASRFSDETRTTMRDLKTHAERAAGNVTPAVKSTIDAITRHPVQAAGEAASTALRGGQLTAGALLGAMSSMLGSAADLMDPDRQRSTTSAPLSKSSDQPTPQEPAS
jgi:hypothetical protein